MSRTLSLSVFAAAIFFAIGLMLPTGAIATGGNGGGGNGGGDGLHNRDRVKKQPRSRRRGTIRKRRTIKRKSRSRKSRSSSRRSAPAVPPAETVEQAAERASTSTKRCVRYNKQFVSRRICMRRMMTQFVKDLTANEKKLPKKTPAKVETVKEVIESMDRKDPKEETISALEKARSAFAVSMEVVTEEDPDGKEGYAKNLEAIENVLEEAYDALAQVG